MSTYTIDYHVPGTAAPQPVSPRRLANLNYLTGSVEHGGNSLLDQAFLRAADWFLLRYGAADRRRFMSAFTVSTEPELISFPGDNKSYGLAVVYVPRLASVRDHTVSTEDIDTDGVAIIVSEEGEIYVADQISDDDDFDDLDEEDSGDHAPLDNKLWDHDRSADLMDRQDALNRELMALLAFRSSQTTPLHQGSASFTYMARDLVVSNTPGLRRARLRRLRQTR